MKKFLVRILISFLGLLLINVAFYLDRKESINEYLKNLNRPFRYKTFVFADSHGNCLKRDAERFNIHNLSYSADSYKDILSKLEYLLGAGADIDTVLLTVDPHTLSSYRDAANNYQYSSLLSNKMDRYLPLFNAQYTTSLPGITELKLKSIIFGRASADTSLTFADLTNAEKDAEIKSRFKNQFPKDDSSDDLRNDLMQILDKCKQEGIVVYGIRFPLVPQYAALVQDHDYGAYDIFINGRIPVLDYQNISLPEVYFSNQDHLNLNGGLELLKRIEQDLRKPIDSSIVVI